jgi:hypothetical protein
MTWNSMTWRKDMTRAYEQGVRDGERGYTPTDIDVESVTSFAACYWQGFGHGARRCACPERLAGKRWGQLCVVCGRRRVQ